MITEESNPYAITHQGITFIDDPSNRQGRTWIIKFEDMSKECIFSMREIQFLKRGLKNFRNIGKTNAVHLKFFKEFEWKRLWTSLYAKAKCRASPRYKEHRKCKGTGKKTRKKCDDCNGSGQIALNDITSKYMRSSYYTDDPIDIIVTSKYRFRIERSDMDFDIINEFAANLRTQYPNRKVTFTPSMDYLWFRLHDLKYWKEEIPKKLMKHKLNCICKECKEHFD